ncbi:MAG TPA: hypothetical protein VD927_15545 [Chryseosolibacter sp.]|nr:hypothetical protein [Chryseosolibacter sp.]
MKPVSQYEQDISSIRLMMEKSVKFISLSGLSGVLAGVYALAGATAAYFMIHYPASPFEYRMYSVNSEEVIGNLLGIAALVLVASLLTGILFSSRKAKKQNTTLWNPVSKTLFLNLAVPLVTGGIFVLIVLYNGHFGIAAPATLIFYGLALISASSQTFEEVRYLGFCEIVIGLIAAAMPGFGLLFWAIGFGVLHIIYGSLMYFRHDQ